MLDWLRTHGVDDVIMSCGFMADGVRSVLGDGASLGIRLRYVEEPTPMGTGGALKYAEALLDERFLVLNGDTLTDIDLTGQIERHAATGALGTLGLYPVEDPSRYGLVRLHDDGQVEGFVEKPSPEQARGANTISAGAYVLERSVLALLDPDTPASIERDVFPRLVGEGLHGYVHEGYWLDIGTPATYLEGTFDILEGTVATAVGARMGDDRICVEEGVATDGGRVIGSALVERGVTMGPGAKVGPRAVLGAGVTLGAGTTVESSVVLPGARIGAGCVLRGCVISAGVVLGDRTHIEDDVILGEGVQVGADNVLAHGARVFPGVALPDGAIRF